MMSNLLPRKLGEVLAFARVGLELLDRAGDSAAKAYGDQLASDMRAQLEAQIERIGALADAEKADKTTAKVRGMMEQYIGDEWDNPIELLEWSGFYLGAAGIHWALIAGLVADEDNDMSAYAESQSQVFAQWLAASFERIKLGESLKS